MVERIKMVILIALDMLKDDLPIVALSVITSVLTYIALSLLFLKR